MTNSEYLIRLWDARGRDRQEAIHVLGLKAKEAVDEDGLLDFLTDSLYEPSVKELIRRLDRWIEGDKMLTQARVEQENVDRDDYGLDNPRDRGATGTSMGSLNK